MRSDRLCASFRPTRVRRPALSLASAALVAAVVTGTALTSAGCAKPKSPTLAPERADVTALTPAGIDVTVRLAVTNPNRIDLVARSFTAHVTVDGRYDLGTVTSERAMTLPASKTTSLAVPLSLKWTDVPALLALGLSNRAVPYRVDGTVNLGGDLLNVNLPFQIDGTISHEQIARATAASIPGLGAVQSR